MKYELKSFSFALLLEIIFHFVLSTAGAALYRYSDVNFESDFLEGLRQLQEIIRPRPTSSQHSKVVFPIPEDVIHNRSYLPDLGFLTDLAFLLLPRDFPASGLVRLSRDLLESEQCVQYVGCEMTQVTQRYESFHWVRTFIQDFPFQGDLVDKLKKGSEDAISRLNERKKMDIGENSKTGSLQDAICTFSCHPINSLSRGLKILSLLHDLVRTVK